MTLPYMKHFLAILGLCLPSLISSAQDYQFRNMAPSKPDPSLKKLNAIAISSTGEVFISDAATKSIRVFDTTGTQINTIASLATPEGTIAFGKPGQIALDASNTLYIYDEGLSKILVRPVTGNGFAFGQKGSSLGQIDDVRGLAVDSKGYIYVLNGTRKQVDIFQPDGTYLTWISGAFNRPFADPLAIGINGANELYVLEKEGPTVFMYDVAGNLINTDRNLSTRPGVKISVPAGMTVAANGDFFILDETSCTTTHFDKIGNVLGTVGTKGAHAKGIFNAVNGIASFSKGQCRMAILDGGSGVAQVFSFLMKSPALKPTLKRMYLTGENTTTLGVADFIMAPNGNRYVIPIDNRKNVIAYNGQTNEEVFGLLDKFGEAFSLATDTASNLYVVDSKNSEIVMYDKAGSFIRKFGKEIAKKLKEPTSLCVQSSGNIIVADHGAGCLHVWDNKGIYLKTITSEENPEITAPFKIDTDAKDQLYIWDDKANAVFRTGINGYPTAKSFIAARPDKPGGKAGVIGGFYLDPLDQVHIYNKTNSQIEIYSWDLEPFMRYSMGYPGSGNASLSQIDNIIFDPQNFRVHFVQSKNKSQKTFDFQVQPPTPENTMSYEVADGRLQVRFNKLVVGSVEAYGLVMRTANGSDSLVAKSSGTTIQLPASNKTDITLKHYGLVSILKNNISDPTSGFDDYFTFGNQLLEAGNYDEALTAYELALMKMGKTKSMVEFISKQLCTTGKTLAENEELGKALNCVELAFSLTPDDKNTRSTYRNVLMVFFQQLANTNDIQGIVSVSEDMMSNPKVEPIVLSSIDTLCMTLAQIPSERSISNSISLQKKLIEWSPGNAAYYGSLATSNFELYQFMSASGVPGKQLDMVLSDAGKYASQAVDGLKRTQQPFTSQELLYSQVLYAQGDYSQIENRVLAVLSESSADLTQEESFLYRTALASSYSAQKKGELAEQEYRSLLQEQPDNSTIKESLAQELVKNKKYDEAQLLYQQLMMKDKDNAHYIAEIGIIEMKKGNYPEASFQLEKAIGQDPADRSYYGALAESYDGASNYKKALDNYKIAVQYLEYRLSPVTNRLQTHAEQVLYKATLEKYLTRVASINENLGNYDESIAAYKKLVELNPDNASAYYGQGKACLNAGLVYDAVNLFYSAYKLDSSNEQYSNAHSNALNMRDDLAKNEPPLKILEIKIKDIFPSLYRNYADVNLLPLGEIVVANNTSSPITPGSVTVFVKELMSQPTQVKSPALVGYSNSSILLTALFTDNILKYTEDQNLQMEITIEYTSKGVPKTLKQTELFTLHGRNAISWADKRRLASFVSPNTNVLIDYNQQGDLIFKNEPLKGINKTILKAIQVYTLLNNSNFIYSPDHTQGFATVTTNTEILDNLQYPSETLKRKSGDCDDLVGVFCGLLENAGVATAYIDIPGHVFMAFDTQVSPANLAMSGLSERDVIIAYNRVWIPVETTLIGTQNFNLAWSNAAQRYYRELQAGNFPEIVPLADARSIYLPSVFVPEGFAEAPPSGDRVIKEYNDEVAELIRKINKVIMDEMESRYVIEESNVYVKNKYATLLANEGESEKAERIFLEALDLSPENPAVLNNLGNIYYLRGDAARAIEFYRRSADIDISDGAILINLCKAHLMLKEKDVAKKYYDDALELDPELGYVYDYLNNIVK